MRAIHILSTVCIVLLVSACASLRDGSPSGVTAPVGVASETPQTPSPAEPTAGAKPTARFDNLPECEGGPNRVSGPPPGPPNGQPVCRATPTAQVQAAKIIGLTIHPDVSEIKVGDTVDFRAELQLSPPGGIPPQIPPPAPGTSYDPVWETDNPAVAAVTRDGNLTARAPGEVTVSARAFGYSATRMLRINPQGR
jgi:hypothetical protein